MNVVGKFPNNLFYFVYIGNYLFIYLGVKVVFHSTGNPIITSFRIIHLQHKDKNELLVVGPTFF